jgi:hypothetical protein
MQGRELQRLHHGAGDVSLIMFFGHWLLLAASSTTISTFCLLGENA